MQVVEAAAVLGLRFEKGQNRKESDRSQLIFLKSIRVY
jgi:hypothetical protein